tara:strand:- start:194 stop:511 length:318 start_codon:yes stop_codon:yes gene_type:complete
MIKITILFFCLISLIACGNSWPEEESKKIYDECVNYNNEFSNSSQSSEDLCSCSMNEFYSEITWADYQKMLKEDLDNDEKAFFNNKVQVVLDRIAKKCNPETLID